MGGKETLILKAFTGKGMMMTVYLLDAAGREEVFPLLIRTSKSQYLVPGLLSQQDSLQGLSIAALGYHLPMVRKKAEAHESKGSQAPLQENRSHAGPISVQPNAPSRCADFIASDGLTLPELVSDQPVLFPLNYSD